MTTVYIAYPVASRTYKLNRFVSLYNVRFYGIVMHIKTTANKIPVMSTIIMYQG